MILGNTHNGILLDPLSADNPVPYANYAVTGKVISVVFCIPQSVTFLGEDGWELGFRSGHSALFDSLRFLSSGESPWQHTVVGWTGEIRAASTQADQLYGMKHLNYSTRHSEIVTVSSSDREELAQQLKRTEHGNIVPVWLMDDSELSSDSVTLKDQSRWRRFAEHQLHTLFHYKQQDATDGRKENLWWMDYVRLNHLFADRIEQEYRAGDLIWIHDYQLLLLPRILRQRLPHAQIGFFFHTSFPSSEYMRCLSQRSEILEGVLGANLIGFQSTDFLRHFLSCCNRILSLDFSEDGVDTEEAHIAVAVIPIGIDAAGTFQAAHKSILVEDKIQDLQEVHSGKRIIFGRDRLGKGVVRKLQAFEMFLDRHADWRGKVILLQVTSPPNVQVESIHLAEKEAAKISELVSRINAKYGSLSYTPVQHYLRHLSKEEYFALLRAADVGLITSARDGMNTASMQYAICQIENQGPLIISEFSGTSNSLTAAMRINPWNLAEVADCLNRALRMSKEERKLQHDKLFKQATTQTVQKWIGQFLDRLVSTDSYSTASDTTPLLDQDEIIRRVNQARDRLFLFDYDGTLTPIVNKPSAAVPSSSLLTVLQNLVADPRNSVWVISGRDQEFLDENLGFIPELGLCAEHGSFVRYPNNHMWKSNVENTDLAWRTEVLDIFRTYTEKTPGSGVEQKKVGLTWHYRNADPTTSIYKARQCQRLLKSTVAKRFDVDIMPGKACIEVRPRLASKSEITKRLLSDGPDFVLCMGDDRTDEDMFVAVENSDIMSEYAFTCIVGPSSKPTRAKSHVMDSDEVLLTLENLTETP